MSEWTWLRIDVIVSLHDRQLAEHGGPSGLRDRNMLESALARPENLAAYGDPDTAALAAAYAFGLVRNHAFVDGNKRTAWIAARVFLSLNDCKLVFDKVDATKTALSLAAGKIGEEEFADWLRDRIA